VRRDVFAYREKNGRRQRSRRDQNDKLEREAISVVMRQPHRMLVPDIYRRSQHAENPIGRLFLLGVIDADDLNAAMAFRKVCVEYHRAIGAPRRLGSNGDLEKVRASGPSYQAELEDDRRARARWLGVRARFEEMTQSVKGVAGNFYEKFVRLVVEDVNEDIPDRVLRGCLSRVSILLR